MGNHPGNSLGVSSELGWGILLGFYFVGIKKKMQTKPQNPVTVQIVQEICNECFVIGGDSNWGFEALGWLQDVNTACVGMAECCVPGSSTD